MLPIFSINPFRIRFVWAIAHIQLDRHVPLFYLNFLLVLKLLRLLNKNSFGMIPLTRYPPTELQLFFQIYFHTIYQNLLPVGI